MHLDSTRLAGRETCRQNMVIEACSSQECLKGGVWHLSCTGGRLGPLGRRMVVISYQEYWEYKEKNVKGSKQRVLSLGHFECEVPIHYSEGKV